MRIDYTSVQIYTQIGWDYRKSCIWFQVGPVDQICLKADEYYEGCKDEY